MNPSPSRRQFLQSSVGLLGLAALKKEAILSPIPTPSAADQIACNVYNWYTFFRREDRDWYADLDAGLGEFVQSGFTGYEPSVSSPDDLESLVPLLEKHGLWMKSLYVGTALHDKELAGDSMKQALAIAKAAKRAGVEIIVTNPNPIAWGSGEDKNDDQLELQAENLNQLGKSFRDMGITLAYHTHDAEMRNSAREFHHMLLATDPENVKLCLDTHWIFRGSGDSQVALFDIIELYASRVVEIHMRQSRGGIWTEEFGEGDIDYNRVAKVISDKGVKPLLVLEQCVEDESPNTMDAVQAHKLGLTYAAEVFGL